MSISPINFNGMIQSTSEAVNSRSQEDAKPQLQQAAVTVEITKREEAAARQVNTYDEARQQEYRYDREGNGKGGQQKSQKKLLKKKSSSSGESDGKVTVKPMSSFDIRI